MVFLVDYGSEFNVPLEKVWKFNQSHREYPHASLSNVWYEPAGGNSYIMSYDFKAEGLSLKIKYKGTVYPPLGIMMEFLDGTFAGSKIFQYYVPKGDKTGVVVVGHLTSPTLSDEETKRVLSIYGQKCFDEDQESITKMSNFMSTKG